LNQIKKLAGSVKGVKGIHDVRAHYVGSYIHVEVHINVDRKATTDRSHSIGKGVQRAIESLPNIDRAFIHIDPL
jgi:divalent metal cation (Fe/Co/Zn/Cd) transporter